MDLDKSRVDGWTVGRTRYLVFQGKLVLKCAVGRVRDIQVHGVLDVKRLNAFSVKEKVWIRAVSGENRTQRHRLVNVIKAVTPRGQMCVSGLHFRLINPFLCVPFCFVPSFTPRHLLTRSLSLCYC